MKYFNVEAICPCTNRPTTFMNVGRDRLRQNEHGETVFRYNDFHDSCEVISVTEVSQAKLDAAESYFKRYGTACE